MLNRIKFFFVGFILAVVVSFTLMAGSVAISAIKEMSADTDVFHEVGEKTIKMLNPDNTRSGGTGFEIKGRSGRTYTMTNAHVCNLSQRNYMIAENNGRRVRLSILDIAQQADLCILEGMPGAEGLSLAREINSGQKLFLVGHPLLQPLTLFTGYMAYRDSLEINYCYAHRVFFEMAEDQAGSEADCIKLVDANIAALDSKPGNSGSAVANSDAEVVGVLFAGNGMGMSLMVPLDILRDYLSIY
jgi:S1-C subfamily serine protease